MPCSDGHLSLGAGLLCHLQSPSPTPPAKPSEIGRNSNPRYNWDPEAQEEEVESAGGLLIGQMVISGAEPPNPSQSLPLSR